MAHPGSAVIPASLAAPAERFQYSPGVRINDLLFIAGQVGRDEAGEPIADPEAQYRVAFENVGTILEGAGTSYANVVDMTTYHTSFDGFELFSEVKSRYFTSEPYPAWTGIAVAALAIPGLLVEIKCIAAL